MAYGKLRVDTLTYDNAGSDVDVDISTIPSGAAIAAKADLASPALTGTPTAPTAAQGTNTTQLATTEFVNAEITADLAAAVGVSVQGYDPQNAVTDVAQTFTAPQRGEITEYTGTAFTIDFSTSNNFVLKPSGNYTVSVTGLTGTAGQTGSIFIQPSAAATITGSWPSVTRFVGGSAGITLTGTSPSIDRIDYIVLDDTSSAEVITCNVTTNYVA